MADSLGQHALDEDGYRAINPNARVPALVDGDLTIYESGAILLYLGAKHGKLVSTDTAMRARMHQLMFFEASAILPNLGGYGLVGEITRPPAQRNEPRIVALHEELRRLLGVLDVELGRSAGEFLCGELSLADAQLFPALDKGVAFGLLDAPASVRRWLGSMNALEPVRVAKHKTQGGAARG